MDNKENKVNISGSAGETLVRAVISLVTVTALSVPAVLLKHPALNVLPLAGVAAMTSLFGSVSGIVCAVITAVCSAYTLSEGNSFVNYSQEGLIGHIAIIFAAAVCIVFISRVRRLYRESAAELESVRAARQQDKSAKE